MHFTIDVNNDIFVKYSEPFDPVQQYVTDSAKRGLIADTNSMYLKACNLTCEYVTTLKFCPTIPLTYHFCLVKYKGDSLKTLENMICQSWEFGKAIQPQSWSHTVSWIWNKIYMWLFIFDTAL